jgi:5'-nucleotidase
MESKPKLTIVHFNDAYHIESRRKDPCGGVSRFLTVVNRYRSQDPLILFSGDLFSPSPMSITMKGQQMIPFLDKLGCHVACVGNHDFDFGTDRLKELIDQTNFPWLITNISWVNS